MSLFLLWAHRIYQQGCQEHNSVWLSLDETALAIHVANRLGNVLRLPYRRDHRLAAAATLGERRAHCTLLAAVTTHPGLQQHLPQFLLPNTTGKKRLWAAAQAANAHVENVHIIPDSQGWINNAKLILVVDAIAAACRRHAPGRRIVLTWDCHATHISPIVLRRLRAHNIQPLLIPSKLTPHLQVLDFAVFAGFKQAYTSAHMRTLIASPTGRQDYAQWIATTTHVLSTPPASARVHTTTAQPSHHTLAHTGISHPVH